MNKTILEPKRRKALVDLGIIAIAAILVFFTASYFNLFERGLSVMERLRDVGNIDELVVVLVFLAFAFAVFSWRRWQELAKETADHREVAEALRASEKKFSVACASSPNPMVITSFPEGRIIDINEAALRALGSRRDELVGRTGTELEFWSRTADWKTIRSLLETQGFVRNFEIEFRHSAGELRYALLSVEKVDIAGEYRLLLVANDITDRKRAENILQATQQQLQTVLNNAPVTIFAVDRDGTFTLSGGKGLQRVGLKAGDNVGVSAYELYRALPVVLPNGTVSSGEDVIRRVLAGETITGVTELRGVYFDNQFVPMRDANNHVVGLVGVATDITDRRRVERDLQRSKEMYRDLIENINDAIISVDIDGRIAYISPVIESLAGFTPSEVIGKPFAEFIYPDDLPRLQEQFHNVLAGNLQDSEYRVFNKAREVRWFRSSSRPIINDGIVVGLRGVVTDVTDRHRKEEALVVLSNAFEQSGDCIMITDRNGVIEYVNAAFESLTGYERGEVLGKMPRILQSGVHGQAFYEAMWREILSGKSFRYAFTNRKKNGEHYIDDRTITPVKDEAGNITHFVSTGRDITERRQIEKKLAEQARILESYFGYSVAPMVILDRQFNFVRVNEAYAKACQRSVSDFPGHNHFEFYPSDTEAIFEHVVHTKTPYRAVDHPFAFPDHPEWGTTYWDWTLTPVLNEDGDVDILVFSLNDVTNRKRSEQKLRDSHARLRALNAHLQNIREEERSRIAREIHDELGQALTGFKMDLSFIEDSLAETHDLERLHEVAETLRSMQNLTDTMIQSVRDIATELRPALLDSLGLLAAIEWQAGEFEKKTGIQCECVLPGESIPLDRAHATPLFRIFQETLTNVVRHAKAKNVTVTLKSERGDLVLEVTDDGVGITEDQLHRPTSFGLQGMKERAFAIDGSVEVKRGARSGTSVVARVPLK